jgi:hypothetical protein
VTAARGGGAPPEVEVLGPLQDRRLPHLRDHAPPLEPTGNAPPAT